MKKFTKENWFKITIITILLGGFCVYYFGYFLPQKRQSTLLDLQEKCSNQAQKFFSNGDNYKNNNGYVFDYKNHFNSKLNKCFILISSYNFNEDVLAVDLYDALEIKHYASYLGHNYCDKTTLSITNDPKKCQVDSGNIWFDGNDAKNPADFIVGFRGLKYGGGAGDENTQKQFIEKIQPFIND